MTAGDEGSKGRIRRGNEQLILKAAEAIFAERGFAGATMADIADASGLPKANLHYYFGTKEDLYRAVLANILDIWLEPSASIHAGADPTTAISAYIRAKMEASRTRPNASKVFANEILHGAPVLKDYLSTNLKALVDDRAAVVERWIAEGLIAPVDPRHFLFWIWAVTQHYADFELQIRLVLGRRKLSRADFEQATAAITAFTLRGIGLVPAAITETHPHPPAPLAAGLFVEAG